MLLIAGMHASAYQDISSDPVEQALTQAIHRVYRQYGSDLGKFLEDVQQRSSDTESSAKQQAVASPVLIPNEQP